MDSIDGTKSRGRIELAITIESDMFHLLMLEKYFYFSSPDIFGTDEVQLAAT